ncbi:unnamed protein product, partial [Effrenium voratum]
NVSTMEVSQVLSTLTGVEEANVYGVQVPGEADGRACMVALSGQGLETTEKLDELQKLCEQELPSYARPKFLRFLSEMETTGTFKHQKVQLREQGFDPAKVSDPVYVFHPELKRYERLDKALIAKLLTGSSKLTLDRTSHAPMPRAARSARSALAALAALRSVGAEPPLEQRRAAPRRKFRGVLEVLHRAIDAFLQRHACRLDRGQLCARGRDGRPFAQGREAFGWDGWAVSGHTGESPEQTAFLFEVAASLAPSAICEVGFNAGHSAATLLAAGPENASYLGFDWPILNPGLNEELFELLRLWLPGHKMEMYWGDAYPKLLQHLAKEEGASCDLIFLDGPHDLLQVLKLLVLLRRLARKGTAYVLLDDVRCDSDMCEHSAIAWDFLRWLGILRELRCRASGGRGACLGRFLWGRLRCGAFDARCVGRLGRLGRAEWAACCDRLGPEAYVVQI